MPTIGALRLRDRSAAVAALSALVTFGIAGFLYKNLIEHDLYVDGPWFLDIGYLSYLLSEGSYWLRTPPIISDFGIPSFYATHICPLLVPFSLLMEASQIGSPQAFTIFYASTFAIGGAVATYIAWMVLKNSAVALRAVLAIAFGLSYSVSGLTLQVASYPHFEQLYVPLATLALVLVFARKKLWSWLALAVCMGVREDTGLHFASFLIVYVAWMRLVCRGPWRDLSYFLPFIFIPIAYAAIVVPIQHRLWPESFALGGVYTGSPPYAHLTLALIVSRLSYLYYYGKHILLFMIAAALPAIGLRRADLALGHIAIIPWFALQLTSFSDAPGLLSLYYPFPFLVVVFWPLIVLAHRPNSADPLSQHPQRHFSWRVTTPKVVGAMVILLVSSNVIKARFINYMAAVIPVDAGFRHQQLEVRNWLLSTPRSRLTDIRGEDSVTALVPEKFGRSNSFLGGDLRPNEVLIVYDRRWRGEIIPKTLVEALASASRLGDTWQARIGASNFWIVARCRDCAMRVLIDNGLSTDGVVFNEGALSRGDEPDLQAKPANSGPDR